MAADHAAGPLICKGFRPAPAYPGYFADPFVLRLPDGSGYAAYGTGRPEQLGPRVFQALYSADLLAWSSRGKVLVRPDPSNSLGDEFWAPEVAFHDGRYWMYYSVGRGIIGHHLRVAVSSSPWGPFYDTGANLTPTEQFAIDAHPFRNADGAWYLYFARDVLDVPRAGTHLAVAAMASMTQLAAPPTAILAPNADWQIYERQRLHYGRRHDWHTLEGPSVVRRLGRYWLTYSGGAWIGPDYAVSWAVADTPMGPWQHAPDESHRLLATTPGGYLGPGHNSVTVDPAGRDVIAFHAWDQQHRKRQLHLRSVQFQSDGPVLALEEFRPKRRP